MSRALSNDSFQSYFEESVYFDEPASGAFDPRFELDAGDRIGAPPRRPPNTMLSASATIACLAAAGWAWMQLPDAWKDRAAQAAGALIEGEASAPRVSETAPPADAARAIEPPEIQTSVQEVQTAPGATAGQAAAEPLGPPAPPQTASTTATAADLEAAAGADTQSDADATPEPLPAPVADAADPYQQKALAAGLHPGLSRVLLARLSASDYRTASRAIARALSETALGESLLWPRQPAANAAQFEVKLVAASGADCRRYIVIVSKDRWSTTAPAMETCGETDRGTLQARGR